MWWRRRWLLVGAPMLIGLVHVGLVATRYFVGSFDDDSSYILAARALLHGQGLTGHLVNGSVVVGSYPPGYPALLAPLAWIWPHTFVPMRILSVVCYAAVFPLTWVYLRRRNVSDGLIGMALLALALSPPLATFGSMVMADMPFLVLFLVFLILVDRWDQQDKDFTGTGVAVFLAGAALVWLKEAAVGMLVGLVIWELWTRRGKPGWTSLRRSSGLVAATVILVLPVIVARIMAGIPFAGSRYSVELGGYYQGGLASRLVHVLPHGAWQMFSTAPAVTLVPYLSPLPTSGHIPDVWKVFEWHVIIFVVVGAVVWFRRHRDAAIVIVPVYLAETLLWPYVNERRVLLVIPVIAAWYVMGALAVWHALRDRLEARRAEWLGRVKTASVGLAVLAVGLPLVVQLPRDYLFNLGQSSSQFEGSRYMAVLSAAGQKSTIVETDYLYSTALFSGHPTARSAFDAALGLCYTPAMEEAIAKDSAGFLLLGDVNKPGIMDSPCLLQIAATSPWSVELLHTSRDDASVFELIGPGTAHPGLTDLGAKVAPFTVRSGDTATVTVDWKAPSVVSQVSVGEAAFATGPTESSTLEIRTITGIWEPVAAANRAVGDGSGSAPFLLTNLPPGTVATGARVVLRGPDAASALLVNDLHALGSNTGAPK